MNFGKLIRSLSLSLVFVLGMLNLNGAHIVGGDMRYECISIDTINNEATYAIFFTLYRDVFCTNCAPLDPTATIGIFVGDGQNWNVFRVRNINLGSRGNINAEDNDPCVIIPPNVGVEFGQYNFEITLPISSLTYKIGYQRCCRNNTINNIINPGETGAVFSVDIFPEAQRSCNDSPRFIQFPPIVICSDFDVDFDHSAVDAEGDLIVYEFCTPQASGGTDGSTTPGDEDTCTGVRPSPERCPPPWGEAIFLVPTYTTSRPMGGNPVVAINPSTGRISGVPNILGQYVVGVCAKEYRNGVLIGEIRRDFQFNVAFCQPTVVADIATDQPDAGGKIVINSCGSLDVDFENLSTVEENIISYEWSFDINGSTEILTERNVQVSFPDTGQYLGKMILNEGLACSDSVDLVVNIYPEIVADFEYSYDTCVAGDIDFQDMSFTGADQLTAWDWTFDNDNGSDMQNPSHRYDSPGMKDILLSVTDNNGCQDTLVSQIEWFPVPPLILLSPNQFVGCAPAEIFFNNLSSPIDETYLLEWDFGDGVDPDGAVSPSHTYEEEGVYSVSVKVTSPIGCETEGDFPNLIRIVPSPQAGFSFTPEEPNYLEPSVDFIDESVGAVSWQWDLDGEAVVFDQNPSYTFRDTGVYEILQIVKHESGCTDTAFASIDIVPEVSVFLPNAFTPNGDSDNDEFLPVGLYDGMSGYSMSIWNRWGERVFFTEDPFAAWDGSKNNAGIPSPQGVYVYVVKYIEPRGERIIEEGYVTLLR